MTESQSAEALDDNLIGTIARAFASGRVVPFLGAGVNRPSRPSGSSWVVGKPYLPVGSELSLHLARLARYPALEESEHKNLLRVAQYLATMHGSGPLRDELRKIFVEQKYEPTLVHRFLARLPRILRATREGHDSACGLVIITTNYDDLLEQAFREEGVEFDVLTYRPERSRGCFWHLRPSGEIVKIDEPHRYEEVPLNVRPVIVKLHGTIDRTDRADDSYVITEDDYIDYLGRDLANSLPRILKYELLQSHFLFLGYSLQDWNVLVFLKSLRDERVGCDYTSWAIQLNPKSMDRQRWESRNVKIVETPLEEFISAIDCRVRAVDDVPPDHG